MALKLRYADFQTTTHAKTIDPTNEDPVVFQTIRSLLNESYTRRQAIRLIGVRLSNFEDHEQLGLDLFPQDQKTQDILRVMDEIRGKYGSGVIHLGKP